MQRVTRRQVVLGVGAVGLGLGTGCGPLRFPRSLPTPVKVYRVGFLNGTSPAAVTSSLDIFWQALGELGYVEGQNLILEYRWGDGNETRLAEPAAELAHLPVDGFVVPSTGLALIAHEATTNIPIVQVGAGDPVAAGLAASYARPGGNVTGVINLSQPLNSKRLQLVKEAVPPISRVAVVWDVTAPGPFPAESWGRDAQAVGVKLHPIAPRDPDEFESAFESAAREGVDALIVAPSPLTIANRARIVQAAARLGWPAMYFRRQFVDEGGLMAYDGSLADLWRRAAVQVDKILKGANPADIPIEQPTRFDFIINLQTAQALGLTIPQAVMLQATEVIQ